MATGTARGRRRRDEAARRPWIRSSRDEMR
jgi:hypothetical protein